MVKKLLFVSFIVGLIALRLVYDLVIAVPNSPGIPDLAEEHLADTRLRFVILMDGEIDNCRPCYSEFETLTTLAETFPDTGYLVLARTDFEKEMVAYYGLPAKVLEVDRPALRKWYHLSEGTKVFVLDSAGRIITILPLGQSNPKARERYYYELLHAY